MAHLVTFIIGALFVNNVLINNVALVQWQSVFPVLQGNTLAITRILSASLLLVIPVTAGISKAFSLWVLAPLHTEYLSTLALGVLVVTLAPAATRFARHWIKSPTTFSPLPLSLLMANAMLLTVAALQVQQLQVQELQLHEHQWHELQSYKLSLYKDMTSVVMAFLYGLGTAAGYAFAQEIFCGLRERIEVASVPKAFAGAPLDLITVGLMALALMGLSGLTRV